MMLLGPNLVLNTSYNPPGHTNVDFQPAWAQAILVLGFRVFMAAKAEAAEEEEIRSRQCSKLAQRQKMLLTSP